MSSSLISDTSVNTEYITKVVRMCNEAYNNLCLLALNRRSDFSNISCLVRNQMNQQLLPKDDSLSREFASMAYIAAIANELGRSLMGILYMGPNERTELLRHILEQINAENITNYKAESVNGRETFYFESFYSNLDEKSDRSSLSDYILKFIKEQDFGKGVSNYTLSISYVEKPDGQKGQNPLLNGTLRIWEEENGDLANFINNVIFLNNTEEKDLSDREKQEDKNEQEKSRNTSVEAVNKDEKTEKKFFQDQASFLVIPYKGALKENTNYHTESYYVKIQIDDVTNVFIPVSIADKQRLLYVSAGNYVQHKDNILSKNLSLYKTPYQINGQISITTFENDLSHLLEKHTAEEGEEHVRENTKKTVMNQVSGMNDTARTESIAKTKNTDKKLIQVIPYKGELKNITSKETRLYYCRVYADDSSERFIPVSYAIESGELFVLEDYVNRYKDQIVIPQLHLYENPCVKEKKDLHSKSQKIAKPSSSVNATTPVKAYSQESGQNGKKALEYHIPPTRILVNSNGEVCPSCGYSNNSQWKKLFDKNGENRILEVCCCKKCNSFYLTRGMYDSFKNSKERYKFELTFMQSKTFGKKNKKDQKPRIQVNHSSVTHSDNDRICPYCGKKYEGELYNDGVFGFGIGMCRKCYKDYRKAMND